MKEIIRFTTDPEPCPYLRERSARQHVRIVAALTPREYSRLLASGWRRFGHAVFRPSCAGCQECVPLRVPVAAFEPSKSQRRVLRRNADLVVDVGAPTVDDERLELYRRFHEHRSRSRGWPAASIEVGQYLDTFVDNALPTLEVRYLCDGRLVAIAYVGEGADGLNSIYAFSDPDVSRRGLGTFDILMEIEHARKLGKQFLYLGYRVAECGSMSYKADFKPHEILVGGVWKRVNRSKRVAPDASPTRTGAGPEKG